MSPEMTDGPVLVTVLPARTAYDDAVASGTSVVAALASGAIHNTAAADVKNSATAALTGER